MLFLVTRLNEHVKFNAEAGREFSYKMIECFAHKRVKVESRSLVVCLIYHLWKMFRRKHAQIALLHILFSFLKIIHVSLYFSGYGKWFIHSIKSSPALDNFICLLILQIWEYNMLHYIHRQKNLILNFYLKEAIGNELTRDTVTASDNALHFV